VSDVAERYGPWALVAGASDGVGAAYARAMAERGVNVLLLARRLAALDEVAEGIRAETGVEARTLTIDLAEPDAFDRIASTTDDLEVGMLMYNAGADPNVQPFLANDVDVALGMVQRNAALPLRLCHHLGGRMVERGRGGIVLVSSGAGLVGAPNMVAYAATKAFDIVLAESLWSEWHDLGVDVLGLVLGMTDTPALRTLLAQRGVPVPDDQPMEGASTAAEVVDEALANLANGPTWFVGEQLRSSAPLLGGMARSDAVRIMIEHGGLPGEGR
jgi:short-subunit dehydrogenase